MVVDQLLGSVRIKCKGPKEVTLPINDVTKRIWAELPVKDLACVDAADDKGTSAGAEVAISLDVMPSGWCEATENSMVFRAVLNNVRALVSTGGGGGRNNGGGGRNKQRRR